MNEITELLLKVFRSEAFTILASISSIISLILTFYVFLDLRRIKNYYVFAARVPELIKKLQEPTSNLLSYWRNFETSSLEIKQELAHSEAVLESLRDKLEGEPQKAVEELIFEIKNYDQKLKKKEGLLSIHLNMSI